MRKLLTLLFLFCIHILQAQSGIKTTTYFPNGDVIENADEKIDTIELCSGWKAVGITENRLKESYWKYFHNDLLCYSGTYRKGIRQGEWRSEDPAAKLNYRNGQLDGEIIYYHLNSIKIEQKRHYVAGKAHGDWITYDVDGTTPVEIRHYKNDSATGVWEIHNGKILYKGATNRYGYNGWWTTSINDTVVGGGNYVNGVQEGEWIEVDYPGNKSVGRYVNGQKEGRWRWYSNGWLETSGEFVNGKEHGTDTTWVGNRITFITHWYQGRRDGVCTHFHENGNKESEYVYDRITRGATYRSFDENGNLIISGQLIINPDFLILEADNENNCRVAVHPEHALPLIEMGICFWQCRGSSHEKPETDLDSIVRYLRSEQFRKDTMGPHRPWTTPIYLRTGVWTEYYPGKKKKEEGMYEARAKQNMYNGEITYFKTGWWRVYAESGSLLREERYENGVLIETRDRKK